jgi:dGTPase
MQWSDLLNETRVQDLIRTGPTTKSPRDPRTPFERDYDRAVFSTPVRRLQDKAQVFPLESLDAVRTRLTHSLEVSTVARDLAGQAAAWLRDDKNAIVPQQANSIQSIAATCGLLHDLGNPPFGHAGETAIQTWFRGRTLQSENPLASLTSQQSDDFSRFEGNAQTIRIVSRLQVIAHEFGLNLTCGTMSALCKYTATSDDKNPLKYQELKKPGFFWSETDLINSIRDVTKTGPARNPITYLVEAADDLVYATIDLEDGVKRGILDSDALFDSLKGESDPNGDLKSCITNAESYLAKSTIPLTGKSRGEALAVFFRNTVLSEAVPFVVDQFKGAYADIMSGNYHHDLVELSRAGPIISACKTVARRHIYNTEDVLRLEVMGRNVIHDLMDLFWEGASHDGSDDTRDFPGKIFKLMSPNYRFVYQQAIKAGFPKSYCKCQLVSDYICGMTDTFACTLHNRLNNG